MEGIKIRNTKRNKINFSNVILNYRTVLIILLTLLLNKLLLVIFPLKLRIVNRKVITVEEKHLSLLYKIWKLRIKKENQSFIEIGSVWLQNTHSLLRMPRHYGKKEGTRIMCRQDDIARAMIDVQDIDVDPGKSVSLKDLQDASTSGTNQRDTPQEEIQDLPELPDIEESFDETSSEFNIGDCFK
ncbi:hypothetical protein Avbf_10549 [Armadillidium vulgare]|nr:hypothetical protein Avbf_10549 [Armadillidium vulgare]